MDLSLNLKAVIAQRLIPGKHGHLVPATEIMLQSPYVSDLIRKGQIEQLKTAVGNSQELGMHTFDQSLFQLYLAGEVTAEQAIDNADSKTDLSLQIRLNRANPPPPAGLSIEK